MQSCELCQDLWRKYGIATKIHVQLDNKLRFAALQDDHGLVQSLTMETEGAEQIRTDLREAIRKHEKSHSLAATQKQRATDSPK
jgi:hypothetical protein